jgi:hypothetical protein
MHRECRTRWLLWIVLFVLLLYMKALKRINYSELLRILRATKLNWCLLITLFLMSFWSISPNSYLLELKTQRSQLYATFYTIFSLESDRSVENFLGLFLIWNDFLNLLKKDMIVVANKVDLMTLVIIENAATDVQTIQHFVVMIEYLFQREVSRTVDTQYTTYWTYYDLVNFMFSK